MSEINTSIPPKIIESLPYPQGLETIKKYGKYHKITWIKDEEVGPDDYCEFRCEKK